MADKRISQLVERTDIANNDVVPIVASGATTTNKATISSIQEFMQENLDLGVTSVGITLGTTGTDVNVTGSPITTSGNITLNIPDASTTARGLVNTIPQTFNGSKTFSLNLNVAGLTVGRGASNGNQFNGIAGNTALGQQALFSITTGFPNTAVGVEALRNITTGVNNIGIGSEAGKVDVISGAANATSNSSIYIGNNSKPNANGGSNEVVIGHNAAGSGSNTVTIGNSSTTLNRFFGRVMHGDAVAADESATLGQVNTSLGGYVTLGTAQTITAQKTFTTSGSSDTMIISHGSGSGFALDVIKAGNGEAIRVQKTSGSGNAMTVIGGNFEAPTIVRTGGTSSQFLKADGSVDSSTYLTTSTAASTYITIATPTTITGVKTFDTGTLILAAAGTANSTHLRNSSGDGTSVSGSNVFGFNSSNNIYVRTQSKGGFIFNFNNGAANRTYTLPDATGTISLTSDLGSYVPYTGATGAVDLGTHTLSANNVIANGGFNAGALLLKNANAASTINTGYFTLSPSSTTTQISFGFSTGASTWKRLVFSSHLLTDNTPTLFSFPNGGGTLAVTTDLGAYLPLTGGTLTGALNGTTASFTGTATTRGLVVDGANNANISQFAMTRTDSSWGIFNSTDLQFVNSLSNTTTPTNLRFVITAGGNVGIGTAVGVAPSGYGTTLQIAAGSGIDTSFVLGDGVGTSTNRYFAARPGSSGDFIFGTDVGNISFRTGLNPGTSVGTERLRIASTGAATFSSSVTAASGYYLKHTNTNTIAAIEQFSGTQGAGFSLFNSSGTQNVLFNAGGDSFIRGGNVGIGTASPATQLSILSSTASSSTLDAIFNITNDIDSNIRVFVTGSNSTDKRAGIGSTTNTALCLITNNTERMRITSGGALFVGKTTATGGYDHAFYNVTNQGSVVFGQTSSESNPCAAAWNNADSGDNVFIRFFINAAGNTAGSIDYLRSAGLVRYNTTSDGNLKNIIGDSDRKKSIDILNSTRIREYSWKEDETNKPQIGVIAQELHQTYKGAVSVGSDDELLGSEDYKPWAVDKTAFTFHLVAGFQEHERIIKELQEQINSLKNQIK